MKLIRIYALAVFCAFGTDISAQEGMENLGSRINSPYSEKGPIISPDGRTLYFHRTNHPQNRYGARDSQDIWYSIMDENGNWLQSKRLPEPLNTGKYNTLKGVTPDGNTLLIEGKFVNNRYAGRGLSMTHRTAEGWEDLQSLEITNYQQMAVGIYGSSSLSNDGESLIMAFSEVYGSNFDDLYVSHLQQDGTWSRPKNFGAQVNTRYTETTPFIASDGITVYFSSNRPGGSGKNDIYYIKRLDETWQNWTEPVNMGPSINSEAWEAYYSIAASGDYAYMVSNKGSIGKGDIVRIKLKEELRPDPVVLVYGRVFNKTTRQPLSAQIDYELLPDGEHAGQANSDAEGHYKIVLPYGKNYGFQAQAPNFIAISDHLDLREIASYKELERDLYLVPIEVGETVRLNNIFFDFDHSELRPESFPELNRIAALMADKPSMQIELRGHTDNVGTHDHNQQLSSQRAFSVQKYLISKGVNASRIDARGFGETKPISNNDSEINRQLNRRVEFVILKK